jgi:hypothetical protein
MKKRHKYGPLPNLLVPHVAGEPWDEWNEERGFIPVLHWSAESSLGKGVTRDATPVIWRVVLRGEGWSLGKGVIRDTTPVIWRVVQYLAREGWSPGKGVIRDATPVIWMVVLGREGWSPGKGVIRNATPVIWRVVLGG